MKRIEQPSWEELAKKAKFDLPNLARLCGVSIRTLQRHFGKTHGVNPGKWLRELRLQEAYQRILAGEPVKCVAYDVHYKQLSHFSRAFKEHFGVPPSTVSPRRFPARAKCNISPEQISPDRGDSDPQWNVPILFEEANWDTSFGKCVGLSQTRHARATSTQRFPPENCFGI